MLSIKHSHHFHLTIPHHGAPMALSRVLTENDELIQAIEADNQSGKFTLDDADAGQLDQFWSGVEKDIQNDPEWFTFADD